VKKILTLILLITSLTSAVALMIKNMAPKIVDPVAQLYVGDTIAGGIVFWIAPLSRVGDNKPHGLVCSPIVQSGGIAWCRDNCERLPGLTTDVGMADDGSIKTGGSSNTNSIVARYGDTTYAANICKTLDLNGHTDWFLPSRDELDLMYQNLKRFGIGNFANGYYWSSSQYNAATTDTNLVWAQFFGNGRQYKLTKNYAGYVRAVRAF